MRKPPARQPGASSTDIDHDDDKPSLAPTTPLAAAQRGMYVFPLKPGTKDGHLVASWPKWSTADIETIVAEFAGRQLNYGIDCGKSRLVVIDEDQPGEFQRWADDHGHTIPATFTVRTAHGRHYYFLVPEGVTIGNADSMFAGFAINVRGAGGYVLGPGSTHPSGAVYTAENDLDPVPVPQWLIDALTEINGSLISVSGPFELPERITSTITGGPPSRDEVLYKYACSLQARHVPKVEALASMQHVAFPRVEQPEGHPYPLAKALSKVEQAYQRFGDGYTGGGTPNGHKPTRELTLTPASGIKVRPVWWLWEGRLPLGALGLLAGREGIGKSTIAYTVAAQVTRGTLPGRHRGRPKAVIVAATEDSWEYTIVPRLTAAGADLNLVYRVDVTTSEGVDSTLSLPRDIVALRNRVAEVDAALILLDPLMSRLDAALDSHKDGQVRLALEPVVDIADKTGCAVLGLIHVNKSTSTDPLTTVMASRAFVAVARAVLFAMVDPDHDQRRLLGQPKNNLGRGDLPTLTYTIETTFVADTDDGPVYTGRVVWGDDSSRDIREALAAAGLDEDSRTATSEAAAWLEDYLADNGGTADSADIKRDGAKAGHSADALKRARSRVKVKYVSYGKPRRTRWDLPGTQLDDAPVGAAPGESALTALTTPTVETRGVQSVQSVQSEQTRETLLQLAAGYAADCDACRRGWVFESGPCPQHQPKDAA